MGSQIVRFDVSEEHSDLHRRDELARQFRRRLAERGVAAVPSGGPPPPGAKSATAAAIGTVAVAVGSSPVIAALVEGVFAWLSARGRRTVRVSVGDRVIELSDPSPEQERHLIAWITQHAGPS
ncbi:effector-associated constant component EACC1 [Actinocorallia longicatena]|uniref:Uncharacterized protein n=1 Tax=Actinocorallia longicatena TaxID=111803 RepID=A0ABP6QMP3_9ACTN